MNEKPRDPHDHLEGNVERLLGRAQAERAMPQAERDRALRALLDASAGGPAGLPGGRKASIGTGRYWTWWTAAAAALLLIAIFFWPGGLQDGAVWADVVAYLEQAETLAARVTLHDTPPSAPTRTGYARLYQKDPGLTRSEIYAAPDASSAGPGDWPVTDDTVATLVVITASRQDEATILRLTPGEKLAHRTTLTFGGGAREARSAMPLDLVSESWSRLKRITSDRTRVVGERTIDGISTVGFETDIGELFGEPEASPLRGAVRIWAESGSGVPIEVEAEFRDERGWHHLTRFWNLEWNRPLADAWFEAPDLDGWKILEVRDHQVEFSKTGLRDGVTLRVGSPGGAAVFTEREVEAVVSGRAVRQAGQEAARTSLRLTTTPAGAKKLEAFTSRHLGEPMEFDFNGEIRFEIRIGGVIGREMQLDITPLGMTLEQFEASYLTD